MECNGDCNDEKLPSVKISCPGPYNNEPQKLRISKDGRVTEEYKDMCQETQIVRIAYYNRPLFEVVNGTMVDIPGFLVTGSDTTISYEQEIMVNFFKKYHIEPIWIDCNGSAGYLDETGNWTGTLEKVNKYDCVLKRYILLCRA